jgi:hypothetical protein
MLIRIKVNALHGTLMLLGHAYDGMCRVTSAHNNAIFTNEDLTSSSHKLMLLGDTTVIRACSKAHNDHHQRRETVPVKTTTLHVRDDLCRVPECDAARIETTSYHAHRESATLGACETPSNRREAIRRRRYTDRSLKVLGLRSASTHISSA